MATPKLEVLTIEKKLLLDYDEMETVFQLKHKLYMDADINVTPSKQRLYYFGKLLQDHKTLGSYTIDPSKYLLVMIHDVRDHDAPAKKARKTRKKCAKRNSKNLLSVLEKNKHLFSESESREFGANRMKSVSATFSELKQFQYTAKSSYPPYSTFDGFKNDPLFLNLVRAMNKPTDSTDEVEEAVQLLIEVDSVVLDLIYENLGEFLCLCSEPEKIGDTSDATCKI